MRKARIAIAAIVTLFASAAGAGPAGAAAARAAALTTSSVSAAVVTPNGAWTVYHRDDAHTGFDSTQPAATTATTGWTSTALDDQVYGSPLVYQGIVYVATLNNTVYALNQADGTVIWSRNLRAPETSGWSCGNVSPQGILGTPVIDAAGGRIYVTTLDGTDDLYRVEGLNLTTGVEELNTVVTTKAATGFDWTIQQERGALAIANGYVYVPFGGRAGDCGPYHGWIFAVPINGTAVTHWYVTPGQGAGFWTAGGVVVDDSTGKVFDTSGNGTSSGCNANLNGTPQFENDAVVRLSSTLAHEDAFIPQDWQANWCNNDQDLGSASMVLISPTLAFQAGKWGNGFLVNPQSLGGMDGQRYPTPSPMTYGPVDVCRGNNSDANFGSYAYAAPYVYLSCEGNGLVALKVDSSVPSFSGCGSVCSSPSWNATGFHPGPPIVAGGAVWAIDINGGGLYGFNATTGAQIYHSGSFGVNHFSTPSEAGGLIFVSAGNQVRSFNMVAGCTSVTVGASPPSPALVGTAVTINASASGCPNPSPLYQFWIFAPGASGWTVAQPYSTNASFSWNTAAKASGTYRFSVWVHDASNTGTYSNSLGRYDAFNAGLFYTLTSTACSAVSVSASPSSAAAMVGTPVTIAGNASGCPNPLYQFWIFAPGASSWSVAQPYSTNASFNWNTTGKPAGSYRFSVWVRDATSTGSFSNSLGSYDAFNAGQFFTLTFGCAAVSVSTSPSSSANIGTPVSINASASGCLNPNPLYQFWIFAPGASSWAVAQPYSTNASFNWNTTGKPAGTYRFSVWVHDASNTGVFSNSLGRYDAFNAGQFFTLTSIPCSTVSASASPTSPATVGTPVTITGSATGCSNPLYEFWILPPGGSWTLAQAYSSSPTLNWTTSGQPAGSYLFSVWARDAGSPGTSGTDPNKYDAFSAFQYMLS